MVLPAYDRNVGAGWGVGRGWDDNAEEAPEEESQRGSER